MENIGALCGHGEYQPLIKYYEPVFEKWLDTDPQRVMVCSECNDSRYAKDLQISISYDRIDIKCADKCYSGKGLRIPVGEKEGV